jgi:hypothetical protein
MKLGNMEATNLWYIKLPMSTLLRNMKATNLWSIKLPMLIFHQTTDDI